MRDSEEIERGWAADESERETNENAGKKQIENLRERWERERTSGEVVTVVCAMM